MELARVGEARHFIAWTGAVAGLRGGSLSALAVASEAVLTDVLLSGDEGGTLRVESEVAADALKTTIRHPERRRRRMADLDSILEQYLDGHEITPTYVVLVKQVCDRTE